MKRAVILLTLLIMSSGAAFAEKENEKIRVAVTYGAFFPESSAVKTNFGSSWTRFGLTSFEPVKPTKARLIMEVGSYRLNGPTEVRLLPVTFGLERGIGNRPTAQPYVVLRAGPYFGKIEERATGLEDHHVGLNANASVGIVIKRTFYAEARYDYFSRFAGSNFSGLSLSAGVRLFDIKL